MTPLDAREWLEAQRLAGNPFALELLEMLDEQDHLRDCENAAVNARTFMQAALMAEREATARGAMQ